MNLMDWHISSALRRRLIKKSDSQLTKTLLLYSRTKAAISTDFTLIQYDSTVHGYKSRFLGMPLSLHASQIDKYEIHAEMSTKSEVKE